jgi:hypothetical protein
VRIEVVVGLLLAAIYASAALVIGARYAGWENAEHEKIVLIRKFGSEPRSAGQLGPLKEACAGKLEKGGPFSLVGYVVPLVDSDDDEIGDRVMGLVEYPNVPVNSGVRFDASQTWVRYPGSPRTILGEFVGALDPMSWKYKTRPEGSGGKPRVRDARYVAITTPRDLVWPVDQGNVYIPGTARLETRVVTLPEGKLVCEGESTVTHGGRIEMEGRGKTMAEAETQAVARLSFHVKAYFISAIQYGPLFPICEAPGNDFCDQVGHEAPRY